MLGLEVTIDAQPDLRLFQVYGLNNFLIDIGNGFLAVGQAHLLLAHLKRQFLAIFLYGEHAAVAVEGCQTGTVAILHLRQVQADEATARRTLHTLRQRVGSQIEVGHHAVGLQTQESRTLRQAPCLVNGIMVPLPVQAQL